MLLDLLLPQQLETAFLPLRILFIGAELAAVYAIVMSVKAASSDEVTQQTRTNIYSALGAIIGVALVFYAVFAFASSLDG